MNHIGCLSVATGFSSPVHMSHAACSIALSSELPDVQMRIISSALDIPQDSDVISELARRRRELVNSHGVSNPLNSMFNGFASLRKPALMALAALHGLNISGYTSSAARARFRTWPLMGSIGVPSISLHSTVSSSLATSPTAMPSVSATSHMFSIRRAIRTAERLRDAEVKMRWLDSMDTRLTRSPSMQDCPPKRAFHRLASRPMTNTVRTLLNWCANHHITIRRTIYNVWAIDAHNKSGYWPRPPQLSDYYLIHEYTGFHFNLNSPTKNRQILIVNSSEVSVKTRRISREETHHLGRNSSQTGSDSCHAANAIYHAEVWMQVLISSGLNFLRIRQKLIWTPMQHSRTLRELWNISSSQQ